MLYHDLDPYLYLNYVLVSKCNMTQTIRKGKVDSKCYVSEKKRSVGSFVIQTSGNDVCLTCKETVVILKECSIRRHYVHLFLSNCAKYSEKLHACKMAAVRVPCQNKRIFWHREKITSQY
jgi:hypothetical protein